MPGWVGGGWWWVIFLARWNGPPAPGAHCSRSEMSIQHAEGIVREGMQL